MVNILPQNHNQPIIEKFFYRNRTKIKILFLQKILAYRI